MTMTADEIKSIVRQVLAEERDAYEAAHDTVVLKTISAILTGFGIEDDDKDEKREIKEDFRYLRRWRKGSEKITGLGLTAIVTVFVGGLVSALGLGIKAMVGK